MAYKITHSIHPSNETRLTLTKVRGVFLSLKERAARTLSVAPEEVRDLASSAPAISSLTRHSLGFQNVASQRLKNSHARTKFGKPAITNIYRAAGALDRSDSDVGNYLFLTATLPGDTDESKWAIAEYAHVVIDLLKSWLSKRLLSRNEFYVWEHQKRGALHFHYCIHCPDKSVQASIAAGFKAQMVRIYDGIQKKFSCDLWGKHKLLGFDGKAAILQARVEVVYKSVGSYMAGYLGGKDNKHSRDYLHDYYPKRWYGISRPLNALVKSMTEKQEYEFTSLKSANEFYEATRDEILDDALTVKDFKHKVGEGKTTSLFHTPEKQEELWDSKKMIIYKPQRYPVISGFISQTLKNIQKLHSALENSKRLRDTLPLKYVLSFQDVTFQASLRNGALKRTQIQMLEKVFCTYDFRLSSDCRINGLYSSLKDYNLLAARYYPQMRFNSRGFLQNSCDWREILDTPTTVCYRGTTSPNGSDASGVDSSRAHVASEDTPTYIQEKLW